MRDAVGTKRDCFAPLGDGSGDAPGAGASNRGRARDSPPAYNDLRYSTKSVVSAALNPRPK